MSLMSKHLIDFSFNVGVLFDPGHFDISDHLLVVYLLEMNLFQIVILQVIFEFIKLISMISKGMCQFLYLVQVCQKEMIIVILHLQLIFVKSKLLNFFKSLFNLCINLLNDLGVFFNLNIILDVRCILLESLH